MNIMSNKGWAEKIIHVVCISFVMVIATVLVAVGINPYNLPDIARLKIVIPFIVLLFALVLVDGISPYWFEIKQGSHQKWLYYSCEARDKILGKLINTKTNQIKLAIYIAFLKWEYVDVPDEDNAIVSMALFKKLYL